MPQDFRDVDLIVRLMIKRQNMERQLLVEHLSRLSIEKLVAVPRELFDIRIPYPEETSFNHSRFFLGIASSLLESDDGGSEQWGPWELTAVAYPDPAHYIGLGPDWGSASLEVALSAGSMLTPMLRKVSVPSAGPPFT